MDCIFFHCHNKFFNIKFLIKDFCYFKFELLLIYLLIESLIEELHFCNQFQQFSLH